MSTPTEHFRGMEIPGLATPANLKDIFGRYSNRAGTIVEVDSRVEAGQVLADAQAAGVTGTALYVWQTDIRQLLRHPNTGAVGEGWEAVAGRYHGATVAMTSNGGAGLATLRDAQWDALYVGAFIRASDGWTTTSDGIGIIVPETGMYEVYLWGLIDGDRTTLGRVLVDLVRNNGSERYYHTPPPNENRIGASFGPLAFTKGEWAKVEIYHAAGGTRGFTGELNIVQSGAPRWS